MFHMAFWPCMTIEPIKPVFIPRNIDLACSLRVNFLQHTFVICHHILIWKLKCQRFNYNSCFSWATLIWSCEIKAGVSKKNVLQLSWLYVLTTTPTRKKSKKKQAIRNNASSNWLRLLVSLLSSRLVLWWKQPLSASSDLTGKNCYFTQYHSQSVVQQICNVLFTYKHCRSPCNLSVPSDHWGFSDLCSANFAATQSSMWSCNRIQIYWCHWFVLSTPDSSLWWSSNN